MKAILRSGFLALAIMALAAPVNAGPFEDGMRAYVKGDYAVALKLWQPLAEQGDAQAQHNLGMMYESGQGVPKDDNKAVEWYRKAAEQGHANAQYSLDSMQENGQGVLQDNTKAFKDGEAAAQRGDYATALQLWRPLAEQGHARAQVNLGHMYSKGRGVPLDDAEAVKWYRIAAEQGDARAQRNLGLMYAIGRGVPQDYVSGHMWSNLAAAQDYEGARKSLDMVARDMTPDQITEAQRMAREWMAKHQQ